MRLREVEQGRSLQTSREKAKKQGTNSLKDDKETNEEIPSERNAKNKSRKEKYAKIKTDKN